MKEGKYKKDPRQDSGRINFYMRDITRNVSLPNL